MLKITTNHRERDLLSFEELTPKEREWFPYVTVEDEFDARFFRAYGSVYDVYEFESVHRGISVPIVGKAAPGKVNDLDYWDAIQPTSAWSAIAIQMFYKDHDSTPRDGVVVGWVQWH